MLGPNGDLFTPTFLAGFGSLLLAFPFFIWGLYRFWKQNTFLADGKVLQKRVKRVRKVKDDPEKTQVKRATVVIKGIWASLSPNARLFVKTQIPTIVILVLGLCFFTIALADLLIK